MVGAPSIVPEVGRRAMVTPFSISAFPVRGYSIAEGVVGVNTLMQSPLFVAGRHLNAWEGYNYNSVPCESPQWPQLHLRLRGGVVAEITAEIRQI